MVNKFEQLASWYLRLNGYFTVPNFVLHPDIPGSERTDADLLAVRFPYSREVAGSQMECDVDLLRHDEKIDFIIAEVKSGKCRLNGPWTNPNAQNMHYVLKWLGMIKEESEIQKVAGELYQNSIYEGKDWGLRLTCFGKEESSHLQSNVVQITHYKAIQFISDRFRNHGEIKSSNNQWDDFIRKFYVMAVRRDDPCAIMEWISSNR